ncbi:hypothetical protein [Dokdonella sp.]|uniref:hypothetical protein n=1 Tax=Dokdonella sp. TaxID=2291710 RepID=UPI002F3EC965
MRRVGELIVAVVFGMQMHDLSARTVFDVRAKLEMFGETLRVTIQNGPQESVPVPTPLVVWRPGVGGVEFKVWTMKGAELHECAMIDYGPGVQGRVELKPSGSVTQIFTIADVLKRNFCLRGGRYFVQAFFHNELDGKELSETLASNPLIVEIGT